MLDDKGFDEWSKKYDEQVSEDKFPFLGYKKVLTTLLELSEAKKDQKILDIGIGTGMLANNLSKSGSIIYGIDFSKQMLDIAKTRIPNGIFENVDVVNNYLGSFSNIKFDRIISSYFFHHLNEKQKIEFIKRVIKNNLLANGMIVFADVGFKTSEDYKNGHKNYQKLWDEEEYYLCGDELVGKLNEEGIDIKYQQISECAGILIYKDNSIICGEKIYLRKPLKEELSFIKWLWSDEESMKEVGGTIIMTDEELLKWYQRRVFPGSKTDYYTIIFDRNNIPVGEVSCHRMDLVSGQANFNIKIAAKYRGNGYAKEAMVIFLRNFFNNLGGKCMIDDIASTNNVSKEIFLKFGFELISETGEVTKVQITKERFLKLYRF
ncbi:MAG: GNAT family N-acetyltransferase [Oligoflexia bacterium]|nr:GNAT family N-acetyltransferase [Oligoflexia bacterium]